MSRLAHPRYRAVVVPEARIDRETRRDAEPVLGLAVTAILSRSGCDSTTY